MSDDALSRPALERAAPPPVLSLTIGWRNLWRNRRRTWLTAGGVAFAVFLVVIAMCIQLGSYATMKETATSLLTGHLQISHAGYPDDNRIDHSVPGAGALLARVREVPGVEGAAPRIEGFALASAGERSFGAQVLGVDPAAERQVVNFEERVTVGRHLDNAEEGVLGVALARNLGVGVGDEVVLLGSARQGGVAALVLTVVGLFQTGMAEMDRALLLAPIDDVRLAFDLDDQLHTLVVRAADLSAVDALAARLDEVLGPRWPAGTDHGAPLVIRTWDKVLPDLKQAIEIDRISGALFYWIIMVLVAFSVVNTFIMTVFERTREFGMLLAVGMRPRRIIAMLQWEAGFLWVLGCSVGLALAVPLNLWLMNTGIYLGAEMEQMAREMYMPTRIYPAFTTQALVTAPLVMLVGTQIAALLPALRIRRISPADALRAAA